MKITDPSSVPSTADFHQSLPDLQPVAQAARRDVVVIGAGVVGMSSALWLQRAGHRVVVCDPHPPVPGQPYDAAASYGNACTLAYAACLPVSMPGMALQVPGMLLDSSGPLTLFWRDLFRMTPWLWAFLKAGRTSEFDRIVRQLGLLLRLAEAGHAPLMQQAGLTHLVRRTGCMYLYRSESQFNESRLGYEARLSQGVRMEVLNADAIRDLEPGLAPLYAKGLRFLDTTTLDNPHQYLMGLARDFVARGGRLVKAKVDGVISEGSGLVVRGGGQTLAVGERVVLAAGAWSRDMAKRFGDDILLDTERGYHVTYPGSVGLLNQPVCYPEHAFYMTPLQDGLRAAGTVELGGLGQPVRPHRLEIIDRKARRLLPGLGPSGSTWLGYRPSMPDSLPAIGPSVRDSRLIHAFGHGHIGLTLGGLTGRLVAELVSEQPTSIDLAPLAPHRF